MPAPPRTCPTTTCSPRTSVFVTNGGYGGVQQALRHGVPLVVTGGQEEKPEVAARVAWSGAGIRFKQASPGPDALRGAVRTVLADDRYRAAARRLSAGMERASGLAALARLIDGLG